MTESIESDAFSQALQESAKSLNGLLTAGTIEAEPKAEEAKAEEPKKVEKNNEEAKAEGKTKTYGKRKALPEGADEFRKFVEEHKMYIERDGNKYLLVEAWLYLFHKKGVHPVITHVDIDRVSDRNKFNYGVIDCTATASLIDDKTDKVITKCLMQCDNRGQTGIMAKEWAVVSLAQTRAIAKLGRQAYGWLPISIGCKATPAEEMGLELKGDKGE